MIYKPTFSEVLFGVVAPNRGYSTRKSTTYEDRELHYDYEITKEDTKIKIEVKSTKKENRQDQNEDSNIIWLEYRAVRYKNNIERPGWLFGESDAISILDGKIFKFIRTKRLKEYALIVCPNWTENVLPSPRTNKPFRKPLTRFSREGEPRYDIILMDEFKNVENLVEAEWTITDNEYFEGLELWRKYV